MQGRAAFFAPADANCAQQRIAAANDEFIHSEMSS